MKGGPERGSGVRGPWPLWAVTADVQVERRGPRDGLAHVGAVLGKPSASLLEHFHARRI
jgi:hypothetical protein